MNASSKTMLVAGFGALMSVVALGLAPQQTTTITPDAPKLAKTLVNECAAIQTGEIVMIEGSTRDTELLENIAIETRKLGAFPFITLGSDRLTRAMYTDVPAKFDSQDPTFGLKLADTVDAMITIDYSEKPDLLADVDSKRLMAHVKAEEPVMKKMLERGVVSVNLGNDLYPTKARAERFGMTQAELAKIFWEGVNCDYKQLQTIGANVKTKLTSGKTVHVTAPNGTDFTVDVTSRPVFVSDGVVSSEDRYAKGPACQVWLPAGEVYVTPVSGTAKGTFVADSFYFEGNRIEGLTFKFDGGKLTTFTAKSGDLTKLKARYDAAPTGKEVFAMLDLGINPKVTVPANSKMVTWMGAGTISIGFGNNFWAGGDNTTPFDVSAHLLNGTLTIDGTKLIDQGKLTTN